MTALTPTRPPVRTRQERALSPEPHLGQHGKEVQPFGTLRLVPIALAAEARAESCQLLNAILADTMILYALYKKHHWLVAGATFYQLHLLFDKHAAEQLEFVEPDRGTGAELGWHRRRRSPPRRRADPYRAAPQRRLKLGRFKCAPVRLSCGVGLDPATPSGMWVMAYPNG